MTTFGSQDIGFKEIKNTFNNINSDFIRYKIFDPPYSHHSSPYIYNNNNPGGFLVESRISENSSGNAWVMYTAFSPYTSDNANTNNTLYYYQINVSSGGNVKNYISGVVTAGRANYTSSQYITHWKFQYSSDGSTWHWVDNGKIFNGNNDDSSEKNIIFSTPVYSTGIRYFPAGYYGGASARMALLIDTESETEYKIFDPPYSHHSSDYTYLNNSPGESRVESRISETTGGYAWVMRVETSWGNQTHANQNNVDNPESAPYYYQIDVSSGGNVKNYISGVVTAGRTNNEQYVTQWKFQYSSNGSTWHWVDNGKIFNGNNDDSSEKNIIFSTPVYTVGIRFFPIAITNNVSARMALLIDHEIFDPPYNHHTSNATFRSLTSASEGIGMKNNMSGRLSETDKWWDGTTTEDYYVESLFTLSNKSHYWQINVSVNNALKKVTGVVVKGRADTSVQYITQWNFTYSTDGSTWIDVPGGTYSGNFNNDETVFIFFSEPVLTTGIQFCPATYQNYPSARMALLMSKEVKANELNDYEEIFDPPYTHHSSTANGIAIVGTDNSGLGRLSEMYNTSGWVIRIKTGYSSFSWATTTYINADNDEYYWQIDITADGKGKRLVKGVVTKGRRNGNYGIGGDRVTKLKLQYSNDGNNWYWVDGGYTFKGNDDPNINNFIYFTESVVTTGIRFFPTEYVSDPAMRMALILDNKLYSSALELSEPFNKKEVLDIEWGYRKGFASILENNKIHTLLAIDDLGSYGWGKNHLISKTSYPVENNIYELSLKLMENTITSYFFFGIHFDNKVGPQSDFFKNMGKYQLYSHDGGAQQRNYNDSGGGLVTTTFGNILYNKFLKIIVDGINGKVQFVVNDVLQTTKEYSLSAEELTGRFYIKIDGERGKAVLRLRKLDNFPSNLKGVNPGDNIGELDIEWGTTTGFTSTKIAADGREKIYQLTSSSSGSWGSHKLISSTRYPMKDNIYILSLRKSSGNFFFGIDYTTTNSQDASPSYLHHFMKYQVYYSGNVTSRFYNEPHTEAASHGSTTNNLTDANSNTYIDMILDGINGKVQFIINGIKHLNFEYTMNDSDLNGHFYVKVDSSSINETAYLSLRKYSSWQQINVSENYTETKNVAGIALKGLSDQTYIDEVKLDRICNKVEWNRTSSGTNITFHDDNSVTSTINIVRTEAYFASKEKIYYSDKIQGVRFKVKNSGNNNLMFGFGRNGYFIHKIHDEEPRNDLNYAFYFDEYDGDQSTKLLTGSYPSDLGSDIANYDDTTIFDIKIEGTSVKFYINNVVQLGSYVVDYSHFPLYLMGTMNGEVTSLVVDDQNNELDLDNPDNITTITHSTTGVGYLITENFVETTTTVLKVLKFKFNEIQGLTNGGVKDYIGFGGSGTHTGINWYKNIQFGFRRGEGGTNSNNRNRIFICEYNGTSTSVMQQWGTTDDPIQTNTFEIQIFNNTVKYWKENTSGSRTLLHTSSNSLLSSNNQLFVKVNMTSANAVTSKIYNIELGNGSLPGSGVKEVELTGDWCVPITKNLELVTDDEFTEKIEWYENGTAGKTEYMDITNNGTVLRRAKDAEYINWGSYASSVDTFSFSNDYYQGIKCKAIHTTDWVLFGFKNKDDPATNNTDYIQYGFYINPYTRPNNIIRIYEGGNGSKDFQLSTIFNPGTPATLSHYSLDDTFEVRIKGMQVEYLINDVVIYYSEIPANSDYEFEFAITNWGSSLPDDSQQGWKYPTPHIHPGVKNVKKIKKYVSNIEWGTPTNFTIAGNSIVQSYNSLNNWDSKLKSITQIERNDDCWQGFQFQPYVESWGSSASTPIRNYIQLGLGNADFSTDNSYDNEIEYFFYLKTDTNDENIEIRHLSTSKWPSTRHYTPDDKFRILVKGDTIRYIINDSIVYEQMISNGIKYPLYIKMTGTSSQRGVKNVKLITKDVEEKEKENHWSKNIVWGASLNMNIISNNYVVSSSNLTSYNSYIKSITSIERDDLNWQGIKFQPTGSYWGTTTSNPTPYRTNIMIDLSNPNFITSNNFHKDLEYPYYLGSVGNKIAIGDYSGSREGLLDDTFDVEYTEYDTFQIMVKGEQIRYIINGVVYHELPHGDIVYPLYIKMANASSKHGVRNLQILRSNVFKTNRVLDPNKQRNILFNKPIEANSIRVTPLKWHNISSNNYGEIKAIVSKQNIGNGDTIIYDPHYQYHSSNSHYLSSTNEMGSVTTNRGSLVKKIDGTWIPNHDVSLVATRENLLGESSGGEGPSHTWQYFGDSGKSILGTISNIVGTPIWGWPGNVGNAVSVASYTGTANGGPIYKNPDPTALPSYVCPFNGNGYIKYSYFNIDTDGNYVFANRGYYGDKILSESEFQSYIDTIDSYHLTKIFDGKLYFDGVEKTMIAFDDYPAYKLSYIRTIINTGNIWYEVETSKNNECKNINAINVNTGSLGIHFQIEFHVAIGGGECRVSKNGNNIDVYEPYDGTTNPKRGINTWVFDSGGNHIDDHGIHWRDMFAGATGRANWELWTNDVKNRNKGDIIVVSSKDFISAPGYPSSTWSFFDSYGSTVMKGKANEGGQLPEQSRYGCCCVFIYGKPELGIYEYVSASYQVAESPRDVYVYKDFIKTSGRNGYMTSFKLQYKNNSNQYVDLNSGSEYTFSSAPSNTVNDVTKTITFDPPLSAKSIRLFPLSWHNFITARINMKIKNVNIQTQIRNTSFSNDVIYRGEMSEENVLDNKKYFQPQDSYTFNLFDSTNFVGSTNQHAGIGGAEVGETLVANIPFDIVDDLAISDVSWDSTTFLNMALDTLDTTRISKTGSPGWNSFAMSSTQPIYRNDNIWQGVKFQFINDSKHVMVGLGNGIDTDVTDNGHKRQIFTIYLQSTGTNKVTIKYRDIDESGAIFTQQIYDTDIFEIRVKGRVVQYLKNNAVFYTSANTPSYPLYVKSSLHSVGDGIKNVQIYAYPENVITSDVSWDSTASSNVDFNANGGIATTVQSPTGGDYWPAYAMSNDIIYQNNDNYQSIKFQKKTLGSEFAIGLSLNHENWNGETNRYNDIDFALVVRENGHTNVIEIYEKDEYPNITVHISPTTPETTLEDIFEVRVKGTTVEYLKNNALFYTSTNAASFPLYVRSAIKFGGIKNVQIHYLNHNSFRRPPGLTWDSSNSSGINYQNGGIIKNTASTAYSISEQYFEYNPNLIQGVRFQVTHSSVHLFIGFGDGDWSESSGGSRSYADFQHNLHIRANDNPYYSVYNAGVNSGGALLFSGEFNTPYTENDIFEIRIIGYSVEYLKNDVVFYKSTVTSVFPLYLKTRIDNLNDGFKNMERFSYNPQSTKKSLYTLEVESGKMGGDINHYKFYDTFIQKYSNNSWYLGFYSGDIKVINISLELIPNNKILLRYNGSGDATPNPIPEGWYNKMEDYYTTNRNNAYHLRKLVITIKKSNENNARYENNYNQQYIIWDKDNDNNVRYENNNTELYNTYSGSFIAWDTYAISKTKIERNDNHWQVLSFQLGSTSSTHFTRLGIGHTTEWNIGGVGIIPHNYYQVDFQWYIRDNSNYQIQEGNITSYEPYASTGTHGGFASTPATISTDDIYEIRIKGDIVQYFRNGNLVYTSTKTPVYPLYIKYVTECYPAGNLIPNQGVKNVQLYRKKIANTVSYGIKNAFKYSGDLTVGNYEEVYNKTDVVTSDISWDSTTFLNMALDTLDTTRISKTGSNGWNSFAMSSTQPIYRNDNIWQGVKFQFISGSDYLMVGLGQRVSTDFENHGEKMKRIDFALYLKPAASQIIIHEYIYGSTGSLYNNAITISDTDIFEVRVKGTVIEYLKNNAVFYTSTNTPLYPLYVKSSFYNENDGIKNVQIYRYIQPTISPTILPEYNQQNIQWNLNKTKNIDFNADGSITRDPILGTGWHSWTVATEKIYQNNDVYQGIKCNANQTYGYVVFGLKDSEGEMVVGNTNALTYGMYINAHTNKSGSDTYTDHAIRIRENDNNNKDFHEGAADPNDPHDDENAGYLQNYTTDDILEVRVKGTEIEYLVNNVVIYYSTIEATFPLYPCIASWGAWDFPNSPNSIGAAVGIKNIQLDINHSPYAAKSEFTWDTSNSHNIDFNSDGSITPKTISWESRTISHQLIHYNPNLIQGVRFQIRNTTGHEMMGLGVDTNWDVVGTSHYNAIHFATYFVPGSGGVVRVYESDPTLGVSSNNISVQSSSFNIGNTTDDIFEVRVIGKTVEYVKNGEVYYTSANEAVFPLYVKACLYSDGFKNIELFKDRYPLRRVEWDENHSVNVKIDNTRKVIKNGNTNAWDSNCFSIQK